MSKLTEILKIPEEALRVNCTIAELDSISEVNRRKLYLYGEIMSVDSCEDEFGPSVSPTSALVKKILAINEKDKDIKPEERDPIMLYINSPGGELEEGFALVSAIELSKTPIYTVNIGEWCSMAFLIGITGKRRLSLPYVRFLMHKPSGGTIGKISDMEAKIAFDRKFSDHAIREIVLRHSKMSEIEYDAVAQKEFYMLPSEALKYGFIDEIVTDIDTIL